MDDSEENNQVEEFTERLKNLHHSTKLTQTEAKRLAILFLHARKFDVNRSFELYKAYRHMRYSQQLEETDPSDEGLRRELLSEKFTVLPHLDTSQPTVLLFTVKRHWPPNCTDRDVLRSIFYQLDAALLDDHCHKTGFIIIYDMTEARYSNFAADLTVKLLHMLTGCYPARLNKVLIIAAPFWFLPPFHISLLFVKEKIRERISVIEADQLLQYLPAGMIPVSLGGSLFHSHSDWLKACFRRHGYAFPRDYFTGRPLAQRRTRILENGTPTETSRALSQSMRFSTISGPLKRSSTFRVNEVGYQPRESRLKRAPTACVKRNSPCGSLFKSQTRHSVEAFCARFRLSTMQTFEAEFDSLFKGQPVSGPIECFKNPCNWSSNRYVDVPRLDKSAVLLSNDVYIHANWVDGYKSPKAYILTQGPMDRTMDTFWQMVWETGSSIIIILTKTSEGRRLKCSQYWPALMGRASPKTTTFANFSVTNTLETVEAGGLYRKSRLCLTKIKNQSRKLTNNVESSDRMIDHLAFLGWPDFDVPNDAKDLLHFLAAVKTLSTEKKLTTPIIIHCSAGIGRTGTFTAIDICLERALAEAVVDVAEVVSRIRDQRAGAVQVSKQYAFIYLAVYTHLTASK